MEGQYGRSLRLMRETKQGKEYYLQIADYAVQYVGIRAMEDAQQKCERVYANGEAQKTLTDLAALIGVANKEVIRRGGHPLPVDSEDLEVFAEELAWESFQNRMGNLRDLQHKTLK